jgi:glycosyltransferase involved in cell wall biosynthesis
MKLEVLLSVMNLDKKFLSKMNITSKCTVINQCGKNDFSVYKNFNIYSSKDIGLSNSRNLGLTKLTEDIIVLCDDDVVYNSDYEKMIISEFEKNESADIIIFNIDSPNRKIKLNKKSKRLHLFNILSFSSCRIAFRRKSIGNITFNNLFGAGAKYSSGEDTLFLVDSLNNGLKIYSSTKNIGVVNHNASTWFKGYDEKYFYDKGALFTAINKRHRRFLILQYLLRHRELFTNIKFFKAWKIMREGSKRYLEDLYE